jgi:hypothetical protein
VSRNQWIVLVVVVVAVAVVTLLIIRRVRYIKALKSRGWTFDSSPGLERVLDHQAPPFGLGFVRKVDELISGRTSSGVDFRVFEYACSEGGPRFSERVASVRLPFPLPDLFIGGGTPRAGVNLPAVNVLPDLQVQAHDANYARAVLAGGVPGALQRFRQMAGDRVDLSVDGSNLVSVGAPKEPEALAAYLEALADVARAVAGNGLQSYAIPAPVPRLGFYGRPDWQLIEQDDSLIHRYGLTTIGMNHRTEKVVRSPNDGLPFDAFVHRWQTQRTETYTDSEGRTRTRTVTDDHSEVVLAITLPFAWPLLSVDGGWGGERVRFESEEFNDAFTVRTSEPRFASVVIHPRTMEYLMATRPPGFRIEGQLMRFYPREHDTSLIGLCADVAHGFLARVPSFVWKDHQISPPPFRA